MINWQFTRARPLLSPRKNKKINKNLDANSKKCPDLKLKFVKNNNKSIKLRELDSRKISLKIIWANWRKRRQNMRNANNKLRKLNGKLVTCPEQNNCWRSKKQGMKSLLAWFKDKDLSPINRLKTPQFKKLTNKFKNFCNKSEKRRALWLLN